MSVPRDEALDPGHCYAIRKSFIVVVYSSTSCQTSSDSAGPSIDTAGIKLNVPPADARSRFDAGFKRRPTKRQITSMPSSLQKSRG